MATEATHPPAATDPPPNGAALAKAAPVKERIQVHYNPDDPTALYMDTGHFEQMQRVAQMLARSSLVPAHLRYEPNDEPAIKERRISDCFLITAQAFRWRMDCFAVAQTTFVTPQGKVGYEGKLVAALINTSGRTMGNLKPVYSGPVNTPQRAVQIVGRLKGEDEDRTIEGTVEGWKTSNEKWKSMPDQMLFYRGAREWARRHMPEMMLGIYAEDELEPALEMTRSVDGSFVARRDAANQAATPGAPVVRDPLLEAVGIVDVQATAVPDLVLVPPVDKDQQATKDVKVCAHPSIKPSQIPVGKSHACPDCGEWLSRDPV